MSTYDELLAGARHQAELFRQEATKFHGLAKDYIPQMCEALEKEKNHTKEDIRDRVMKDCLDIWGRTTIEKHIPTEYKDQINRSNRLGKKKHKEESVSQYDDSFPNNNTEENKPMEITTDGQEYQPSYAGKSYENLTEQELNDAHEDFKEDLKTPHQEVIELESLKKQISEKDKKIEELRGGLSQALHDNVIARTQQEQHTNIPPKNDELESLQSIISDREKEIFDKDAKIEELKKQIVSKDEKQILVIKNTIYKDFENELRLAKINGKFDTYVDVGARRIIKIE